LTAPTLSTPADDATDASLTPTLTITNNTSTEGVTHYRFEVSTDSLFVFIAADSSVAQGTSTTSWIVSPQLLPSTVYYWRVFAYNGVIYSNASVIRSFTTNAGLYLTATPSSLNLYGVWNPKSPCSMAAQSVDVSVQWDTALAIGSIDWTSADWISTIYCLGSCVSPARLSVAIDCAAVGNGVYKDTVYVTCPEATNSPLAIPVTLTIGASGTRVMLKK
jgi:hypothetical protein